MTRASARRPGIVPLFLVATLGTLVAGCERDVEYRVKHRVHQAGLESGLASLHAEYHIMERRTWTEWPCLKLGCGNSAKVDHQVWDVSWPLPVGQGTGPAEDTIRPERFLPIDVPPSSRTAAWDPLATRKGAAPDRREFGPDDRLGGWPVLEDWGSGCRRTLPCHVSTADGTHALVIDHIHDTSTGAVVHDLSRAPEYARFIDAAIEHFGFRRGDGQAGRVPTAWALTNDLRFVILHPHITGCWGNDGLREANSLVVYDREAREHTVHVNRELAAAKLAPTLHVQHAWGQADGLHFFSRYGRWPEGGPKERFGCGGEVLMFDTNVTTGVNRPLDASRFVGGRSSDDGTAMFRTHVDLGKGVVELHAYDITRDRRIVHRLAVPRAVMEQIPGDPHWTEERLDQFVRDGGRWGRWTR